MTVAVMLDEISYTVSQFDIRCMRKQILGCFKKRHPYYSYIIMCKYKVWCPIKFSCF